MHLMLVVESHMLPVPAGIKVLDNWGYVGVVDSNGTPLANGDHMHLEGKASDFAQWLGKYDGVWCTKPGTSPMFQQFEVHHIKEHLCASS